jgi:hypothetical protein
LLSRSCGALLFRRLEAAARFLVRTRSDWPGIPNRLAGELEDGASRPKDRNIEGTRRSELSLVKARQFDRLAAGLQKYDRSQMKGIKRARQDRETKQSLLAALLFYRRPRGTAAGYLRGRPYPTLYLLGRWGDRSGSA